MFITKQKYILKKNYRYVFLCNTVKAAHGNLTSFLSFQNILQQNGRISFEFYRLSNRRYINNNYTLCLIQFMLKLVTWFDVYVVQAKKTLEITTVMFNFQYHKGIIKSESKYFYMNLFITFCTLWKVLLLWMNSFFFICLNHV